MKIVVTVDIQKLNGNIHHWTQTYEQEDNIPKKLKLCYWRRLRRKLREIFKNLFKIR